MTTKKKTTVSRAELAANIRKMAEDAMVEQMSKFDTTKFAELVVKDLDKQRSRVTWMLLGLDDKWGKLEVDHCNGRESPITRYLTEATTGVIQTWVNDAVAEVFAAEGDKYKRQVKAAIKKEVEERLHRTTYRVGCDVVEQRIEALVKAVADEVLAETVEP